MLLGAVILLAFVAGFMVTDRVAAKSRPSAGQMRAAQALRVDAHDFKFVNEALVWSEAEATDQSFERLLDFTRHPNESLRYNAFSALADLWDTRWKDRCRQELLRMDQDPDPGVRGATVFMLAKSRTPGWVQRAKLEQATGTERARSSATNALKMEQKWSPVP